MLFGCAICFAVAALVLVGSAGLLVLWHPVKDLTLRPADDDQP